MKQEFNLVLGSRPQLRLPLIIDEENDKIHWEYIPNGIADGNIVVQNGNVGIGTENPQAKLHIVGNVIIENGTIDSRVGTYEASLEYFGCVRDGVADDTPCFQAALDSGISEIIVVPGTYNIQGTLFATTPVTIRGWRETSVVRKTVNTQNPMFVVESPGVAFENLTLRGARAHNGAALSYVTLPASARQSAIALLAGTGNVGVRRCTVENFARGVAAANVSSTTISECSFDTFHTAISTSGTTATTVDASTFSRQWSVAGETAAGRAWTSVDDARPSVFRSRFEDIGDSYAVSWTGGSGGASIRNSTMANVAGVAIATECVDATLEEVSGSTSGAIATATGNVRATLHDLSFDVSSTEPVISVRGSGSAATITSIALRYASPFLEPPIVVDVAGGGTMNGVTVTCTGFSPNAAPVAFVSGGGYVDDLKVDPAPPPTICIGSFVPGADGLGTEVINVDPDASADANVAVFSLAPSALHGLASPTIYARTIPQYANASHELDTIGGLAAVSLSMPTNMAPFIGGTYVSDPSSAAEYSHRLNAPPLPGNFRIFGKIYVESIVDVSYDVPLFLMAPDYARASLAVTGGGSVTLGLLAATTQSAGVVVPMNTWHDIEISARAGTVRIVVNGIEAASASVAYSRPRPTAFFVGSEAWRQGIWTTGWTHEVCDPILRNSATVRGDARMVGNVTATSFEGDGSLLTNIGATSLAGNVECAFM